MDSQRPRILIVEDDEPTATKFMMALQEIGDSRTAERVDQVFKQIIDFDPQLILLDIKLEGEKVYKPEEAGIHILEQIKGLRPPFREVPVVIITAFDDPNIETLCRKLGAVDYYKKPVPLKTLRQAVERAIQEQFNRRQQQINVFISSPMRELEAERRIVKQAIKELGPQYNPELAEDWAARPEPPVQIWQRAARECDIFVLLLGREYGTPSPYTGVSPTEDEYNQAQDAGKPILVFQKELPEQDRAPGLIAFMARLYDPSTGHLVRSFKTPAQLRAEVPRAIRGIIVHKRIIDSRTVPAPEQFTPLNAVEDGTETREVSLPEVGEIESYCDFNLCITSDGQVTAASAEGQATARISIEIPNSIRSSLNLIEKRATDATLLKQVGQELYDWLFPTPIHTHFHQTEAVARAEKTKMRLHLQIEVEDIASLPLEFLYRAVGGYFLAVKPDTVLSRYLNLPLPPRRVRCREGALHMLAIMADPTDQTRLPPDEWEAIIKEALAEPIANDQMTLQTLKRATRKEIRNALLQQKPDIIQFVGHGIYQNGRGYLALVDEKTGKTWLVDDERFANLFLGHDDHLGLISLATCESAKSDNPQGFLGIAPQLVQRGVPAVLSMQYKVYVETAKVFLEDFYTSVAARKPIDWATQSARNAISLEFGLDNREFATPVLYMRAKDGNVF
jgi:DNA-binding response OmpR family regulator/CHAT domain-containing protein